MLECVCSGGGMIVSDGNTEVVLLGKVPVRAQILQGLGWDWTGLRCDTPATKHVSLGPVVMVIVYEWGLTKKLFVSDTLHQYLVFHISITVFCGPLRGFFFF